MIEKMKAVCIVSQSSQKDEMLVALRDMGIMHIAEKKTADILLLERFSKLSQIMNKLKDYEDKNDSFCEDISHEKFEEIYENSILAIERKEALKGVEADLLKELERLNLWGEFDSKLINALPKDLNLHFYKLDKKAYKIAAEDENIKFIRLKPIENMEAIAVLGTLDSSIGAMEFVIPQKGTVQIADELNACREEILKCDKILKEAAKNLKSYSEELLKTENDAQFSSVKRSLEDSEGISWLKGYIPESEIENFEKLAKKNKWAWLMSDIEDGDNLVPTKIKYNKLTNLVKPIFEILGVVPGYREYDISFWFLAFFSLFFAMIIGDAGYGTVFLIGTIIFNLKTKKVTNVMILLYLLSGATIVWGSVTGTWFGLESAMRVPVLKALAIPSIANYPEYFGIETSSVQNNVMKFCFSIGVIQLALACVMNIRRKIAEKSLAWLSDLGWLFSISALYFMVLNLVIGQKVNLMLIGVVVGLGFMMVIIFGGMSPDKTFVQGLKAGLGDSFTVFLNTISAFGNLMSYIRLFAVGMASLAIAQSFNDMSAGFSGALTIVGFLIMAIGHILNIVMGFLSVVVHGVRLNLLEFSGQLGMEWTGVTYEPFKKIKNK